MNVGETFKPTFGRLLLQTSIVIPKCGVNEK